VPPDTYSNLQKGVVDSAAMAFSGMVSMSWYEVAPYLILDGMYACSNFYTVNLDKWNSFDEATQALFLEAAEAGKENSFVLYEEELDAAIATVDDYNAAHGIDATVTSQDQEHIDNMLSVFFKNAAADCRVSAENAGKSSEMETVLSAASDFLGVDF
jgi:TRAP-type C4-dicarboxylate transport system substrate-binding protein